MLERIEGEGPRMIESRSTKHEMRVMARLALPVVGAQVAMIGLSTTDVVMSGQLGKETLAAVGLGNAIANPVWIVFMGILMAVNPIVAQLFGAGEHEDIGSRFRQGLWMAAFLAVPGWFFLRNPEWVLAGIGVAEDLRPLVIAYLRAWSWGIFFCLAYFAVRFFNEGLSHTVPPMFIMIAAIPLNIGANYCLMYGKLGFPALGAVGCGYATALVWGFAFVCLLLWTLCYRGYRRYGLISQTRPRLEHLREIFAIGWPNGVSFGFEVVMFAMVTLLLGTISKEVVAAHQIAINVASVTFMFSLGVGTAGSIRVGQAVGRRSEVGIRRAGKAVLMLSMIVNLVATGVIISSRHLLPGLYTDDPGVRETAALFLLFAGFFQLSDGIQVTVSGALRGLKDTLVPMFANLVSYWVIGIPVGYYLGMVRGLGAPGLWYGLIIGLSVAAVLHGTRFAILLRRRAGAGRPMSDTV